MVRVKYNACESKRFDSSNVSMLRLANGDLCQHAEFSDVKESDFRPPTQAEFKKMQNHSKFTESTITALRASVQAWS